MKEFNGKKLVTMEDWTDSFDKICNVGDYVEERIVDEMINAVPPACINSMCMQCGEPYSHRQDPTNGKCKPTYSTFKKVADGIYEYCGHCFWGTTKEVKDEPIYI